MTPRDTDKSSRTAGHLQAHRHTTSLLTPVMYGDVTAETTDWTAAGERSQQADRSASHRPGGLGQRSRGFPPGAARSVGQLIRF
jgi:hypothetical protein